MLGVSSNTKYKKIEDFKCSADYLSYLYKDANGVVFRMFADNCGVFHQHNTPYSLTERFYEFDFGGNDQYISMQTFLSKKGGKPTRSRECVKRINAFYVDIDCYKVGLTKGQVITALQEEYYGKIIPTPTFVIDSGRGLYLVWKLANEDKNAQSRWERVENFLVNKLEMLGADCGVHDLPRVLRIPFSKNSKSNTIVKILEFNDVVYKIRDIENEYGLSLHKKQYKKIPASKKQKWAVRKIVLSRGVKSPDLSDRKATAEWLSNYSFDIIENKGTHYQKNISSTPKDNVKYLSGCRKDLVTLMSRRKGADCRRENALFLYRLWTYEATKDANLALEATLDFNRSLDCPLPEKAVISATRSAQRKIDKGETYSFKHSSLIKFLSITKEELISLFPLSEIGGFLRKNSDDGQNARDRKKQNHVYYKRCLEKKGETLKKDKIFTRREKIKELIERGVSYDEIISELSISRATLYRDMAYLSSSETETISQKTTDESENHAKERCEKTSKKVFSKFKSVYYKMHSVAVPYRHISSSRRFLRSFIFRSSGFSGAGGGAPP